MTGYLLTLVNAKQVPSSTGSFLRTQNGMGAWVQSSDPPKKQLFLSSVVKEVVISGRHKWMPLLFKNSSIHAICGSNLHAFTESRIEDFSFGY